MIYDVDLGKDIYSCCQADKCIFKRYRALRVLGEKVFVMKRSSFLKNMFIF